MAGVDSIKIDYNEEDDDDYLDFDLWDAIFPPHSSEFTAKKALEEIGRDIDKMHEWEQFGIAGRSRCRHCGVKTTNRRTGESCPAKIQREHTRTYKEEEL